MKNHKQLYVFNTPVRDLLDKISRYCIHFFSSDLDRNIVLVNDVQAQIFNFDSADSMIGSQFLDLLINSEGQEIENNDAVVMKSTVPQLFYESCFDKECMSLKSPILDSANNIIGVGGIAFYFHQICLKDIVGLINNVVYLKPLTERLKYTYTANALEFSKLTDRERQCVYYLAQSMSYKEIARVLNLSPRTVETHMAHIKAKLGCCNRSDIICRVFESGANLQING